MDGIESLLARDREKLEALLCEALTYAHTKTNLARELGVSHQVIGAWLSGHAVPNPTNHLKLMVWLKSSRRRFARGNLSR